MMTILSRSIPPVFNISPLENEAIYYYKQPPFLGGGNTSDNALIISRKEFIDIAKSYNNQKICNESYILASLDLLPKEKFFKERFIKLSFINNLIENEWEYRYFSYFSLWDGIHDLGIIRNGSGDEVYIIFGDDLIFCKIFADAVFSSHPGKLINKLPDVFKEYASQNAFSPNEVTCYVFCKKNKWSALPVMKKYPYLGVMLYNDKELYDFFNELFELGNLENIHLSSEKIQFILDNNSFELDFIRKINPSLSESLVKDILQKHALK